MQLQQNVHSTKKIDSAASERTHYQALTLHAREDALSSRIQYIQVYHSVMTFGIFTVNGLWDFSMLISLYFTTGGKI